MSLLSRPPLPQSEKLVPQIPANVYGGNRPSKPYAKMKVGKSCTCMMFNDSEDGMMVVDNGIEYLEYISRIKMMKNKQTIIG